MNPNEMQMNEGEQLDLGNTEEVSPEMGDLSDDEMAATLGYITTLSEHASMAERAPLEEGETGEAEAPEAPEEDRVAKIEQEVAGLKADIPKMIDEKMADLKLMIQDALSNEQE